jgi:membrane protein
MFYNGHVFMRREKGIENWPFIGEKPRQVIINFKKFGAKLTEHNVFLVAGGIAFNMMLYSLPLGLIIIFIIDKIFGVKNITPALIQFTEDFLPPNAKIDQYLGQVVDEISKISSHSSITGIIGIIALLWFASMLVSAIRNSLNGVLELKAKHFFLLYRLKDMGLTIVLTIAVFLMLYVMPLVSIVTTFAMDMLNKFIPEVLEGALSFTTVTLTSMGVSFIVFLIIYSWVPNQKLPRYIRLWSPLVSAVAIELGRQAFGIYISGFANYGRFYGTFAVLASMVLWLYYFSLIILLSAEVVKFLHDIKYPDVIINGHVVKRDEPTYIKKQVHFFAHRLRKK